MTAEEHKERATILLVNYLGAIGAKAGFRWDADYTVEIGEAVEHIVDAIGAEVEARLLAVERLAANTYAKVEGLDNPPDYVTRARANRERRRPASDPPADVESEQERRRV